MSEFTHYDVLGIPRSANHEDVKKAFMRLAKVYAPDRAEPWNPWPMRIMVMVNNAHDILGDALKRADYDERLENVESQQQPDPLPPEDDSPPVQRQQQQPNPAQSFEAEIWQQLQTMGGSMAKEFVQDGVAELKKAVQRGKRKFFGGGK